MVLCVFIQKIAKNGPQRKFSLIFFFMVFWLKKITTDIVSVVWLCNPQHGAAIPGSSTKIPVTIISQPPCKGVESRRADSQSLEG